MVARLAVMLVALGIALLVFEIAGPHLAGPNDALPVATANTADQVANIIAAIDQSVSMLFTLTIGMFVAVGLLLRNDAEHRQPAHMLAPSVFLAAASAAIYFGLLARLEALQSANFSVAPADRAQDLIGLQGTAVALSGIAMLITSYDFLVAKMLRPR